MFIISFFLYVAVLKGKDEVLAKRARHVITEIQRTREAAEALRKRDFKEVSIMKYFNFSLVLR